MPRKYYPNEERPLTLRIASIRAELDARSDGTEKEYRRVIIRDLQRYYQMCATIVQPVDPRLARNLYDNSDKVFVLTTDAPLSDALERAHVLTMHAGLSVDEALVAVGLVAKGESK